jgi:hypothetical protein
MTNYGEMVESWDLVMARSPTRTPLVRPAETRWRLFATVLAMLAPGDRFAVPLPMSF